MFEEGLSLMRSYGFGGILANFDRQHGNDLFIANDVLANQFWVSQPLSVAKGDSRFGLREQGALSGCATGTHGELQGSMGVASGDFDRNGKLDLHVTNFCNEPVNLFLQQSSGRFVDKAIGMRLHQESLKVLGFGTQAADFNLDGWLDLAVLNGHIYDARHQGIPFQMLAQVFAGGPDGFRQVADGEYWRRPQLGRTLAVLDWNRDGKPDLLATHLDHPIALLENRSSGENWVQLELVGVLSERDAIGAEVKIECGSERWVSWVVGGHGLMCSNEAVIGVGLGSAQTIDRLTIEWPSGQKSIYEEIPSRERYLVVEGKPDVIPRTGLVPEADRAPLK
jgi:hypothetical protein